MHPVTRGIAPARSRTQRIVDQLVAERDALYRAATSSDAEVRALRAELARVRQGAQRLEAERDSALTAHDAALRAHQDLVSAQQEIASDEPHELGPIEHRLRSDLANLRRHRDQAIGLARAEERAQSAAAIGGLRDDLARALASSPDTDTPWAEGTRMVLRSAEAALTRAGAESFGAVGEAFEPERHEAVGQAPGGEDGTIASVQQVGIILQDGRLVRPARVVVYTGSRDA